MNSNDREKEMKEMKEMNRLSTTTPSANGEIPLPRRSPRGLLPSTWAGRTVRVEYVGADGLSTTTSGALLEYFPFGPVLKSVEGDKFALSWDRISLIELQEN